jgi:hypothetical protein
MSTVSKSRSMILATLLCGATGVASVNCGFSNGGGNTAGTTGGAAGTTGGGTAGTTGGGTAGTTGGTAGTTGGTAGTTGGTAGTTGGGPAGTTGGTAGTTGGGPAGTGGGAPPVGGMTGTTTTTFKNYELSGTFPTASVAIATKPGGKLTYAKFVVHSQFLAESCAIADYNDDGIPDISAGRIWYAGTGIATSPINPAGHPFRSGHGALPRDGAGPEINTGVSDDWADAPWDVNGDGAADIINIAQCDVPESNDPAGNPAGTPNKIGTVQVHATAYWYQNPGKAVLAATPDAMWTPHLMHADVRHEQHGLVDMNGDGFPEFYGSCKSCATTKGYYQGDPAALKTNPNAPFTFHPVSASVTFPFGGTGWLHGIGAGDVNGDGKPDLLSREGAWLQGANGTWSATTTCAPGGALPCMIKTPLYDSSVAGDQVGASHMYAADMDKDGCSDIVGADWAHGDKGISWYQQQKAGATCGLTFKKYKFMADVSAANVALWGAGFTEPHALQVVDMDGDGRPDVIAGKMRFAHPNGYGDPDLQGTPYLYVFQNVATPDAHNGGPITLKPVKVDGDPTKAVGTPDGGMGVGRQLSVGHINTDGIPDICISSKVGLAVFMGQ